MDQVSQALLAVGGNSGIAQGQQVYTGASTSQTYSWVCPAGVTSVSVVCVGAGVYSGGGLGYKNNISVTPGNSYTVVAAGYGAYNLESYFINNSTVAGKNPTSGSPYSGGGYVGDGGGNGGSWNNSLGSGGGGAGGYSGNGGDGTANGTTAATGAGGGGGGGFGNGSTLGGGGGGVGLLGQGSNGAGGTSGARGGGGGSGGTSGTAGSADPGGNAGQYGGGAGLATNFFGTQESGAVRIIWPGTTRQFPSTNTGDV